MWISKKEYNKLMDEKKTLVDTVCNKTEQVRNYHQLYVDLLKDYEQMREQLKELQIKYTDEVRKNFELASYLSESKKDQEVQE